MLDGLLARGFASKCKSMIKLTTTRIAVIGRKRNATQKFLKNDVADLLANGHDANSLGRAEGLLAELCLSSCYDYVEYCCECILKHLSVMQKQSDCPEECRVAVSSIMFAAARFSDLPELRDLRHIFQERYGNSLEFFVNQEFVENLASKAPTLERTIRLMKDIASEFSIKWDSKAFEMRMSKPPAYPTNQLKTYGSRSDDKYKLPFAKDNNYNIHKGMESSMKTERTVALAKDIHQRSNGLGDALKGENGPQHFGEQINTHKQQNGRDSTFHKEENYDLPFRGRCAFDADQHSAQKREEEQVVTETERQRSSSHRKLLEYMGNDCRAQNGTDCAVPRRVAPETSSHGGPTVDNPGLRVKSDGKERSFASSGHDLPKIANSVQEKEKEGIKPPYNIAMPPPYRKSRRSRSKHSEFDCNGAPLDPLLRDGVDTGRPQNLGLDSNGAPPLDPLMYNGADTSRSKNSGFDCNGTPLDPSMSNGADGATEGADSGIKTSHHVYDRQIVGAPRGKGDKGHYHQDDGKGDRKRRSSRRRHSKPSSHDDHGATEDVESLKRKSSSRRRERARQGLQILFDDADEHHQKDHEEKMIDKLLLHYSHKPSSYDPAKVRHKLKADPSHCALNDVDNVHERRGRDRPQVNPEMIPPPVRSISLPSEQTAHLEAPKVFTRVASLQPARHVHPKLPDYDDLAARFGAMKAK